MNQQQLSAGWYHLGMITMSPGQNHRVEVYGALEGETVADTVLVVPSGINSARMTYTPTLPNGETVDICASFQR